MSKAIDRARERPKEQPIHKLEQNLLLDNSLEQIAKKMHDTVSKAHDISPGKKKKSDKKNDVQLVHMTPLFDHSGEIKTGTESDSQKATKPTANLFKIERQNEHELTPAEIKTLVPKLQKDAQTLQTFCFDTLSTISGKQISSTAEAVSVAKKQAELKSKGEQPTLTSTAERQKVFLAGLHSPNVIAAFNDLASGINNNYLPAYMKTPTQAWDEAQEHLPKVEKLLNLVDTELSRQRTTPESLCRLLTRTIFVSNELDHFLDEFDRVTCNDRIAKTKEEDIKERANAAAYKQVVEAQQYQLDVINRNFELAQTCDNINKITWNFRENLYSDDGNSSQLDPEKRQMTMLIDNFYKLYSAEQVDKDCQDAKLTDKQRSDIASLKEAIGIILPSMEALRNDCQTGQILNRKRYTAPEYSRVWTNLCVGDWKHGHWIHNLDPVNKLSSDSFDKGLEINDLGRRFQH